MRILRLCAPSTSLAPPCPHSLVLLPFSSALLLHFGAFAGSAPLAYPSMTEDVMGGAQGVLVPALGFFAISRPERRVMVCLSGVNFDGDDVCLRNVSAMDGWDEVHGQKARRKRRYVCGNVSEL